MDAFLFLLFYIILYKIGCFSKRNEVGLLIYGCVFEANAAWSGDLRCVRGEFFFF